MAQRRRKDLDPRHRRRGVRAAVRLCGGLLRRGAVRGGGAGEEGTYFAESWESADGASWTLRASGPAGLGRYGAVLVPHGNRLFLLAGRETPDRFAKEILESPDGASWRSLGEAPFPPRTFPSAWSWGDRLWVYGGAGEGGVLGDFWSSPDGRNWRREPDPPAGPRMGAAFAAGDGAALVACGDGPAGKQGDAWLHDGEWHPAGEELPARLGAAGARFRARWWVSGGNDGRPRGDVRSLGPPSREKF